MQLHLLQFLLKKIFFYQDQFANNVNFQDFFFKDVHQNKKIKGNDFILDLVSGDRLGFF